MRSMRIKRLLSPNWTNFIIYVEILDTDITDGDQTVDLSRPIYHYHYHYHYKQMNEDKWKEFAEYLDFHPLVGSFIDDLDAGIILRHSVKITVT